VTLETDDGALIHLTSFGLRHGPQDVIAALARDERVDPDTYYFRTITSLRDRPPKVRLLESARCGRERRSPP
jgi:hypothetical protein